MSVELAVRESGSGTPLVLLHAFPLHAGMWEAQHEGLRDICRVITPDLRGFGKSPLGNEEPDLDYSADDVARLLDRLGIESAILGGLSMGGYVLMAFLRRYADRVAGVIFANTTATADPQPVRANRERVAAAILAEGTPRVLEEMTPSLLGRTTAGNRPDVLAAVRALVWEARPASVAWAQRAVAHRMDSFRTLQKTKAPALIVMGDEDTRSSEADAHTMIDALPDARLARISDAGHYSAMENPTQFNAAIRGFLNELAG